MKWKNMSLISHFSLFEFFDLLALEKFPKWTKSSLSQHRTTVIPLMFYKQQKKIYCLQQHTVQLKLNVKMVIMQALIVTPDECEGGEHSRRINLP